MDGETTRKDRIRSAAARFKNQAAGPGGGLRVVITGKGGAGKTTLAAFLAHRFAADGAEVLAVDEDPQQNLAYSLGYPPEKAGSLVSLADDPDYIEEKTGSRPGEGWGQMLTLNPDVSDVVDRFGIRISDRLGLLVMGGVSRAASGCLCPENALLSSVVRYIRLREGEVILMDTQAGVEHFGRALSEGFGQALVVTEPTFNAVAVALRSAELASQLGIRKIHLVVNKVRDGGDLLRVQDLIGTAHPFSSVIALPFDPAVLEYEPDVRSVLSSGTGYAAAAEQVYRTIRG